MKYQIVRVNKGGKSNKVIFDAPPLLDELLDPDLKGSDFYDYSSSGMKTSKSRAIELRKQALVQGMDCSRYDDHIKACQAFIDAWNPPILSCIQF